MYSANTWENLRRSLRSKWVLFGVAMGITAGLLFVVICIYDFLAINSPVQEGILVVEGWIPTQALTESVNIFNFGHYSYLVVVGGPIQGSGSDSPDSMTYADLAAKRLETLGLDTKKIVKIRVPGVSTGHTLASAKAVKRWLAGSGTFVCCVDVFTVGVHARKSWIVFRYAVGDRYHVGIISGTEVSCDPRFWFFSRRGIREVTRNLVGYVYYKVYIALSLTTS
jgi:hypothetical protein